MSLFGKIGGALKSVAKVATLPVTAPLKLQATVGSRLLSTVARAVPLPGRSSPAPAPSPSTAIAPRLGWRGMAVPSASSAFAPPDLPTPAQSAWLPSVAAAVASTPPSALAPYAQASPYAPPPGYSTYTPGAPPPAPYAPAPYTPPPPAPSWTAPPPPPPSYVGYGGGGDSGGYGGGGGGGYGGGLYSPAGDPSAYDLDPSEYPQESTDEEQLSDADATAIDYAAFLGDDGGGGLGDWKSSLLSIAKGAASGALSQTVSALAPKPSTPPPSPIAGMSTGMKVAIGAAVATPLLFLALRRREPARAHNPRRRKGARRRSAGRRDARGRFVRRRRR